MEILRFGPGQRRLGGPPGTRNVETKVIMHDERAVVSELSFGRYAMVPPHQDPVNTSLFVVISGAGFVQVGDERTRLNHGEAVVWPPGELHGAYTDGTDMRAIVVEMFGRPPAALIEGTVCDGLELDEGQSGTTPTGASAEPAEGRLAERQIQRDEYDSSSGEPW